jgi:hypothetical protein
MIAKFKSSVCRSVGIVISFLRRGLARAATAALLSGAVLDGLAPTVAYGAPDLPGDVIQVRDGLPFSLQRTACSNVELTVVFYGGSATAGNTAGSPERGYRELLVKHVRQRYPKAGCRGFDFSTPGCGSWLGAFSIGKDTLYGARRLYVLEFAPDDAGMPEQQVGEALEGMVRQLRKNYPETDIVFLYTFAAGQMDAFRKHEVPDSIRVHERIAGHYGIPTVNAASWVEKKVLSGEVVPDAPIDALQATYLESLQALFDQCLARANTNAAPAPHTLPPPLTARPWVNARSVFYDSCKLEGAWRTGQESPLPVFGHVLVSDHPGDTLTMTFKGVAAGYIGVTGPDSGDLEYSIDGGPWKFHNHFLSGTGSAFRVSGALLARDLAPDVAHELKLRVAATRPTGSTGGVIRIGFLLVDGSADDPNGNLPRLARMDAVYAAMAPLHYTPDPERWTHLKRTLKKLEEGPALKIVLLGDSIMGDTASSEFDQIMARRYPRCKIEKIVSIRGSTGCWWYKQENRVQDYVLKYNPDLLMIGGISQREDVESIRAVIKQVRAAMDPDILVMTPAFGSMTDRDAKAYPYAIDPNGKDYRAGLRRMAAEEQVEFLDITGPWAQYLRESGKVYAWFRRDPVHANHRGYQILGRLLDLYFSPRLPAGAAGDKP